MLINKDSIVECDLGRFNCFFFIINCPQHVFWFTKSFWHLPKRSWPMYTCYSVDRELYPIRWIYRQIHVSPKVLFAQKRSHAYNANVYVYINNSQSYDKKYHPVLSLLGIPWSTFVRFIIVFSLSPSFSFSVHRGKGQKEPTREHRRTTRYHGKRAIGGNLIGSRKTQKGYAEIVWPR